MSLPTYVVLAADEDDGVNSVVTWTDEDLCRWEKLVCQSSSSQANCLPRHPRRRLSIRQQEIHGSVGLPSVPKRRESLVVEDQLEARPRRRATLLRDIDLTELQALADEIDKDDDDEDETSVFRDILSPPQRRESAFIEEALDASGVFSYCSHSTSPPLAVVQEHDWEDTSPWDDLMKKKQLVPATMMLPSCPGESEALY